MVSAVLTLESLKLSDSGNLPLKNEQSHSCAASTVTPTLSRQNSEESAFSAAPRQLVPAEHQHSDPDSAQFHLHADKHVHCAASVAKSPPRASMVQSRFAIRMGVDDVWGECAGVDDLSVRPGDVAAEASDFEQPSKASMVQNRFAIRMDLGNLCGDVPGEVEQKVHSCGELQVVHSSSKQSSTASLAQKRFAIRMREEGEFSDTTDLPDSSMQITTSTQWQVQVPAVSKTSPLQAVGKSHIEAKQTGPSVETSLAQKRWAIRFGKETSSTYQFPSTDASTEQPGQLQEVEPPRQPTLAEKRFAIRMEQDDREAGCFAPATESQRSKEGVDVPPVPSASLPRASRVGVAETRFAMRMHDFDGIGVF